VVEFIFIHMIDVKTIQKSALMIITLDVIAINNERLKLFIDVVAKV
jgi:hypothetical protein